MLRQAYQAYAERVTRPSSPQHYRIALGVANDPELLGILLRVRPGHRSASLLLAAVRFLNGVQDDYPAFRDFVLSHSEAVCNVLESRRNQTHSVGRCATILPALATVPGPVALIELGSGVGLGLLLTQYAYEYEQYSGVMTVGEMTSEVRLHCLVSRPFLTRPCLPEVVWSRGIDINPIEPWDSDGIRWIEACIGPDHPQELRLFRAALDSVRKDPPTIIQGDAVEAVGDVIAEAPKDCSVVVFHSAMLMYLARQQRERFSSNLSKVDATWISNEPAWAIDSLLRVLEVPVPQPGAHLLGLDSKALAIAAPNGHWIDWCFTDADIQ